MKAKEMWEAFCKEKGIPIETEYDAWAFGSTDREADELAQLVLEGKKTATASWYDSYVFYKEDLPKKGGYSVVMDSKEEAVCIIENYSVSCEHFCEVSRWHAYLEGEGDRSLNYWRNVHEDFFREEADAIGERFDDYNKVVLEKFNVVYPDEYVSHDDILLVEPTFEMADEMDAYRQEFIDSGDSMDGTGFRFDEIPAEWVERKRRYANPSSVLPDGIVHATQLMAVRKSDGRLVGTIQIRHELNGYLRDFAGHIGYSVRRSERRKGYAKKMLSAVLDYCRALKINEIFVSCIETNEASRRTILSCGGKYINTVKETDRGEILERYVIKEEN
ncbi:MAG: GNAT family N-acetyltransferase [Firmicutes bacterium]|nr:GNAT family N-acetyltransferase [Bacillota bacterium]